MPTHEEPENGRDATAHVEATVDTARGEAVRRREAAREAALEEFVRRTNAARRAAYAQQIERDTPLSEHDPS